MTNSTETFLALDVGEKRIGVAKGDTGVRLAFALETVMVDGSELARIKKMYESERASALVVGYPRNQSGEATKQTAYVEQVVKPLQQEGYTIIFQDESLTSVLAEQHLKQGGKVYTKADIDAHAARIILQDYLDQKVRV